MVAKEGLKMTNLKEEQRSKTDPESFTSHNGVAENSSGSGSDDSDKDNAAKSSSVSSSCSSVASASSGTTSKLALRMADKASLSCSPAEKRFKFEPNEDYLDTLLAMGISINGAKKALYYTGNRSVASATNWIFDHPELDLETPLEEELRRLEAEEDEEDMLDEEEEDEEEEEDSDEEAAMIRHHHNMMHHNHHHHQLHQCMHEVDEDEEDEEHLMAVHSGHNHKGLYNYEVSDETDSDSDDFDEDDIPEFKMVFVVNTSLEMGPGKVAAQVGHAALGVQRVLTAKSAKGQSSSCGSGTATHGSSGAGSQNRYKVTTTDLGLWQDFGEKMVVVKGESTQHLKDLHLMAEDLDLPSFLVKDAGITQVPSGSVTVFGVFGEDEDVNKITGRLKLL